MLVEILAGLLIGASVLLAGAALAPRRRRRAAPQDRTAAPTAGSVATATRAVAVRPDPEDHRGRAGAPAAGADADDPPPGIAMQPLDAWDAVALVVVVGLMLGVPVVGGVLAAFLLPAVALGPLLVLRLLADRAEARGPRPDPAP